MSSLTTFPRRIASSVLVLCTLQCMSCARSPTEVVFTGPAMGTTYTVKVVTHPGQSHAAIEQIIATTLQRVDMQMSRYRVDSEIARFNAQRTTDWIEVGEEFATVVSEAQHMSAQSQGAFDITIAPLVDLWGFGPAHGLTNLPSDTLVDLACARVNYRHLEVRLQPPSLRKLKADIALDVNALAPGFAVDLIAARLLAKGFVNFLVELGGEVRAQGQSIRGQPWRIAVQEPRDSLGTPIAGITLSAQAIATSGDYRDYFELDGKRYSHTIDPRMGRPVQHTLASVSVIASRASRADALATTLMVLGPEHGYDFARRHGLAALFILSDGERFEQRATPEFAGYAVSVSRPGE